VKSVDLDFGVMRTVFVSNVPMIVLCVETEIHAIFVMKKLKCTWHTAISKSETLTLKRQKCALGVLRIVPQLDVTAISMMTPTLAVMKQRKTPHFALITAKLASLLKEYLTELFVSNVLQDMQRMRKLMNVSLVVQLEVKCGMTDLENVPVNLGPAEPPSIMLEPAVPMTSVQMRKDIVYVKILWKHT